MQSNEQSSNSLSAFIDNVCHTSHLRVEADLGDGFVRLRSDEAERRQAAHDIRSSEDIVIEMLRNSRDAGARCIFLATTTAGSQRTIVVIDDGVGVPETHQELIFEPRVTSKLDSVHMDKWGVHGRGMALYSISVNAENARVAMSGSGVGASILVQTNTDTLKEKADQSSFPVVSLADQGRAVIRGPHNIYRTAVEFALEHRKDISVFLGSPAEIAATMYRRGCGRISPVWRPFEGDVETMPLVDRLCFAKNDKELADLCCTMGLDMSARTARRIMDGQIAPLASLSELVEEMILGQAMAQEQTSASLHGNPSRPSGRKSAKSPKFQRDDLAAIEHATRASFEELARAYYLSADVPVEAKVVQGTLRISIPLVNMDE